MTITAHNIVEGLGGRWNHRSAQCKCPAHDDRSPSLSVSESRDGQPLVYCHAGCTQADVINALRSRRLWDGEGFKDRSHPEGFARQHDGLREKQQRERQNYARAIWERADPIKGTLAAEYLKSRKINLPTWPDALGYVPRLEHKPSGKSFPALIGALTGNNGKVVAIQRTWLAIDGSGKAPIDSPKMTLGPMGSAAVRMGKPDTILGLAEGVETALSARQIYQIPVWATLSANRLSRIELPSVVESLVIFADHGKVGMQAAMEATDTYERRGLAVDVMPPRVHFGEDVSDFNDAVRAGA